jgi:hypothetical protein
MAYFMDTSALSEEDRVKAVGIRAEEVSNALLKARSDLADETTIVNALFWTNVDPFGTLVDASTEFRFKPGSDEMVSFTDAFLTNSAEMAKKAGASFGDKAVALGQYCRASVESLSQEVN